MRKKIVQIMLILIWLASILPISALAWGGYVSLSGEKTYHFMWCEELIGAEYNKLRWYDTQKQAESVGLSPCDLCGSVEQFDFEELSEAYFITNDHKLDAALEAALEYGAELGADAGYERFVDQYGSVEDMEGYSFGYDEGYYQGYNQGRSDYENATYADGFDDGYERADAEYKDRISELETVHSKELVDAESKTPWGKMLVVAVIAFVIGDTFGHRNYSDKLLKLEAESGTNKFIIDRIKKENERLTDQLNEQQHVMELLEAIAQKGNLTMEDIADSLYVNYHKSMGYSEEAARAELQKEKQSWPQHK